MENNLLNNDNKKVSNILSKLNNEQLKSIILNKISTEEIIKKYSEKKTGI